MVWLERGTPRTCSAKYLLKKRGYHLMNSKYLKKISSSPKDRTEDGTHWFSLQCVQDSFQFSRSVVSDSLRPHGLQNARPPCPSPTPGVYSNSCPLSWWCHPTISSSVVLFSSRLQFQPTSGSYPVSQFITSGGQSIGTSALVSVLPMNIQDWFPFGLTGWISLQSNGFSRVFSSTTVYRHQFFGFQTSLWSNSHIHTWYWKKIVLTVQTFVSEIMSLFFNMLSRLVIAFLPRSKRLLISWLQSPSAMIWEPPKIKSATVSTISPSICHEVMGWEAMIKPQ